MRHLFGHWEEVECKLRDRHLFIFLDFDGTLTPIVQTPEKALLSKAAKGLLKKISRAPGLKLAFISGRSLRDIKKKIGLKGAIYSGNHGLEIEGPKLKFETPVSARYKKILEQLKSELDRKIAKVKGAFLEDKGLSLALHFRLVDRDEVSFVRTAFHEAVILHLVKNRIKIKEGKKVLEVRPLLEWDKGKVVLWLLSREKFMRFDTFPVYIGDDATDEDAFGALKRTGLTIFVGRPKRSLAQYYLKDTGEVHEFLTKVLRMQEARSRCRN